MLNVMTGVFCHSAIKAAERDHEMVIHSLLPLEKAHVDRFTPVLVKDSSILFMTAGVKWLLGIYIYIDILYIYTVYEIILYPMGANAIRCDTGDAASVAEAE